MMKKYVKTFLLYLLSAVMLAICVTVLSLSKSDKLNIKTETSTTGSEAETSKTASESSSKQSTEKEEADKEMFGVWVPYMSLDMSGTDRSEKAFRSKINNIMKDISDIGANTVILQVRPFCDAIYNSEIFPTSHIISGTQGKEITYDPLAIAVEAAKKYNLSIHAWINPLRVKLNDTPSVLSKNNPYMKWKNDDNSKNDRYTFQNGKSIYLNPAYPEVRKLIIDGVREIVRNYDIDGIQIDDYFYPENNLSADKSEYDTYCKTSSIPLSQKEWRIKNINTLVAGICSAVHSEKDNCIFGISPQCNIDNNLKIGADPSEWCSFYGYADYICPQIYVSETHPTLPFQTAADNWKTLTEKKNIKLYIGLALYKIGTDADSGTWLEKDDNIKSQIDYIRKIGANGFMLYSYDSLSDETVSAEMAFLEQ